MIDGRIGFSLLSRGRIAKTGVPGGILAVGRGGDGGLCEYEYGPLRDGGLDMGVWRC